MPPKNTNRVLVTTPGARLAMQTALALQERDLLAYFVTSYYYKESSFLSKVIRSLPERVSYRLLREMQRRHLEGLDEDHVYSFPHIELLFIALSRTAVLKPFRTHFENFREKSLLSGYRQLMEREQPSALICCDSWAGKLFPYCPAGQTVKILDQNTGHITAMAKTLHEEQDLHPDMADSITPFSDQLIAECTEEALSADHIFVSSDFAKQSLLDIGVSEHCVHTIPYGSDTTRFQPREPNVGAAIRFLFVGLIGQRKGIKYLLEAFKKLRLPNAELELVGVPLGSGKGIAPYRDLFTHTPSVPYQEIHKTFSAADIFVMPTLHESGVLAIHEALASGLPVITTPNAGSIVRDGKDGFIVPIRDVDALAEKMEALYQDSDLRASMSISARKRAEDYSWDRYRSSLGERVQAIVSKG